MTFDSLGLSAELLRAIAEAGYTTPTPVQAQAIPLIMTGRDVQAAAQTGTGKTAGFTLPILHRLQPVANTSLSPARHPIRALILTPTRELAAQVEESVKTYSRYLSLRSTVIYGGVPMDPQIKALRAGVEIVVATPGRLLDHVQQKTLQLSQVEILVLDEADRMLDMGFMPDIRRIISLLPPQRQNLLFSATFSDDIKKLSGGILNHPASVEVARANTTAESITQLIYSVESENKKHLLTHLIKNIPMTQAIVFTRTKEGANRLSHHLERANILAAAIHSDKTQTQRTHSLHQFKSGEIHVLVATDIAARGLDIDQLPFVVNFELPHVPEDYVHRIGRTGRAGSKGCAVSLVCPEEARERSAIEQLIKQTIREEPVPLFAKEDRLRTPGHGSEDHRSRYERRHPEKPYAERRGAGQAVHAMSENQEHDVPYEQVDRKVRRVKDDRSVAFSSRHFSGPPLGLPGLRKPREIPALLGGLLKKPV